MFDFELTIIDNNLAIGNSFNEGQTTTTNLLNTQIKSNRILLVSDCREQGHTHKILDQFDLLDTICIILKTIGYKTMRELLNSDRVEGVG